MNQEIQEVIDQLSERSAFRKMFNKCPVGRKINDRRRTVRRRPGEDTPTYAKRLYHRVKMVTGDNRCLERNSCGNCSKGQQLFVEWLCSEYGFWLGAHLESLFSMLAQEGWDRQLPNACEIGKEINRLKAWQAAEGIHVQGAIDQLASQYSCVETPACIHCELGRGIFKSMLLDMCEHGMDGEWGPFLKEHHTYLF